MVTYSCFSLATLVCSHCRPLEEKHHEPVIDSMADVFWALNKHCFEQLCTWMNDVVNNDGFPCPRAARVDKEQFARKILK